MREAAGCMGRFAGRKQGAGFMKSKTKKGSLVLVAWFVVTLLCIIHMPGARPFCIWSFFAALWYCLLLALNLKSGVKGLATLLMGITVFMFALLFGAFGSIGRDAVIAALVWFGVLAALVFIGRKRRWFSRDFFSKLVNPSASIDDMTGEEFEQYAAQCLQKKGYSNVQTTQKSSDFGADILAVDKKGDTVCFQCKRYSGSVGIKAVQEVSSARSYYGCNKAAVITNAKYTKAAADLASAENVALFDIAYFE